MPHVPTRAGQSAHTHSFETTTGMKDLLWEKIVQMNRATLAGLASRIISLWEDNDSQYPDVLSAFRQEVNVAVQAGVIMESEGEDMKSFKPAGLELMAELEGRVVAEARSQAASHGKSNSTPAALRLSTALILQEERLQAERVVLSCTDTPTTTVADVEAAMMTLQDKSEQQVDTAVALAVTAYYRSHPEDRGLEGDELRGKVRERVAEMSVTTARRNLEESVR